MRNGLILGGLAAILLGATPAAQAQAQEDGAYLSSDEAYAKYFRHAEHSVHWHHQGMFGTYDRAQLQRGFQVYREVCAACHSLDYVAFRNFEELGYSKEQVKALAAEYTVTDGPDDMGEMFDRPGKPSDYVPAPFPNPEAAKAANGGAYPPNLSLIVKAREGHEDYVHALLTGYQDAPADVEVSDGKYYNPYFKSLIISMAPPLMDDLLTYADGTAATVDQMAQDVTAFLAWAGEPKMEHRKSLGLAVLIFLGVFTVFAYFSARRIWSALK